ncbi:MAG TPA: aminotransferase class IV [Stellaceae bacterium]|nr:aminotransferase class IV [Stellaceae bacterium]
MTVWVNGRLVDAGVVDATDRGFTLGDGLFETVRVQEGKPVLFDRHLARLRDGARVLDIPVPATDAALAGAVAALLAAEGMAEGHIRITLTRGPAPRGVLPPASPNPTLLIAGGPIAAAAPVRLVIAESTRRNELSPLCRVKSLNYLDNILARQEAARRGADDAVLLNTAGRVVETTISNLFAVIDGRLVTPPVAEGALPGIMRGVLVERMAAVERPIAPEELRCATAVILTNSLGIRAVVALDGAPCGAATELARQAEAVAARLSA